MLVELLMLTMAAEANLPKAVEYLDARQQAWGEFKPAQSASGTCISCHTGFGYLLVHKGDHPLRSALQKRLAEGDARKGVMPSVESVLAAALMPSDAALERMWKFQIREGEHKGAWNWFALKLDPWETEDSKYFGAALAAVAASTSKSPADQLAELRSYLERKRAGQPLHNRVVLLWTQKGFLAKQERKELEKALLDAQAKDGSWTLASLGPWAKPPQGEGDAYATALAAYTMKRAGLSKHKSFRKAAEWLASHQDASSGSWKATSMNKTYPSGSMMEGFMNDAATAYAVAALQP
jgi:hypothetical protein